MDWDDKMTDDYQSEGERPKIQGAFKVLLWFIAATAILNLFSPLFYYQKIAVIWSHSPLFVLMAFFFGILFPTIIALMAFQSLKSRRGDTPYLFSAYIIYMILGSIALYQVDGQDWKILARILLWVACYLYLRYSKQVERIFPNEERHVSISLFVTIVIISSLFLLFSFRIDDYIQYNLFNDDTVLIDETTLKEDEYSDGLIRLKKPAGLECGTHYINGEEIITLFNDDCVYYLKSGFWEAEVGLVSDSLQEALAGPEFTKYPHELMSDSDFGLEGDPKIAAHRKCLVYYTDPYPTMVDIVLLKDWRTSKYCLVYGKYEQGTGSHTTEILDGIRFQ
jgi:hypothetical protein